MAAARGLLPLHEADLLEVLVFLSGAADAELARAARTTLEVQEPNDLLNVAHSNEASPAVLGYLAALASASPKIHEAVAVNKNTPDQAIALLAQISSNGALLESITLNQQRLIRAPAIIDAILLNPARTGEADRRARETRREFFEKDRGARQIAQELRARGASAAAEFFEIAEFATAGDLSIDDAWLIAQHIEVSDADIDDSWLAREFIEEMMEETPEQVAANIQMVINAERAEAGEVTLERMSLIRRIMFMSVKDRVKLGMKGDREARGILVRDANKVVASAVIHNPRMSEQEIEKIAAMRAVSDEVLRLIGRNRAWTRAYPIIHNLARNPRTPLATAIGILPRLRAKDLQALTLNRNVSEGVRRQAYRISEMRQHG